MGRWVMKLELAPPNQGSNSDGPPCMYSNPPDPEMKARWDELYGEPLMEYFAAPHEARDPRDGTYMRNHHAFTRAAIQ